jgi:hypothetical protein
MVLLVQNFMEAYASPHKIQLWTGGHETLAVNEIVVQHILGLCCIKYLNNMAREPRKCHSAIGQEYVIAVQQSRGLTCVIQLWCGQHCNL